MHLLRIGIELAGRKYLGRRARNRPILTGDIRTAYYGRDPEARGIRRGRGGAVAGDFGRLRRSVEVTEIS